MKLIIFLWVFTFICSLSAQAQCSFEEIFPIKHGLSKFKAATSILGIKNLKEDNEKNRVSARSDPWEYFDYLKDDSVFISRLHYNYYEHPCFKGNRNELYLRFADDKLYKIQISLYFSNNEFDECMKNYNSLLDIFKSNFYDWKPFTTTNDLTNEQVGEGYWFYPNIKRDKIKLNQLTIEYRIEHERRIDTVNQKFYQTNNIENYIIEINYINLNGTKLTNEGF